MNTPGKILIVDDEPDILEFLSYNLRKNGYQVFTARNGEQGYASACEKKPGLIIADILMPYMNGIEMCRKIRQAESLKKTPFIFLSATNDDYKMLAAMDAGGNEFLSKPISVSLITKMVNELFLQHHPGFSLP